MNNLSETLRQLADDLERRPDDKCWQRSLGMTYWEDCSPREALRRFKRSHAIRRKPRMVERTISYPEPMRDAPEEGSFYYVTDPACTTAFRTKWLSGPTDFSFLKRGLCHTTKEAAIAHAKALLGESDD